MAGVSEGSLAHAGAVVAESEVVVWFSPAELLRRGGNTVLLLVGMGAGFPDLVQLLVLAVLSEVVFVFFLLKHLVEAERVLLSLGLLRSLLLHDVVMLEVVEVRVLSFQKLEFRLDFLERLLTCMTVLFLEMKMGEQPL